MRPWFAGEAHNVWVDSTGFTNKPPRAFRSVFSCAAGNTDIQIACYVAVACASSEQRPARLSVWLNLECHVHKLVYIADVLKSKQTKKKRKNN